MSTNELASRGTSASLAPRQPEASVSDSTCNSLPPVGRAGEGGGATSYASPLPNPPHQGEGTLWPLRGFGCHERGRVGQSSASAHRLREHCTAGQAGSGTHGARESCEPNALASGGTGASFAPRQPEASAYGSNCNAFPLRHGSLYLSVLGASVIVGVLALGRHAGGAGAFAECDQRWRLRPKLGCWRSRLSNWASHSSRPMPIGKPISC